MSDIEMGSSKTLADAAAHQLLRLTSPFQRSAALLWPCLVTPLPLSIPWTKPEVQTDQARVGRVGLCCTNTRLVFFFFPQNDVNNVRCIHPHPPGNVTRKELSESGSAFGRRFPSLCRQRGVKVEQSVSLMQPLHRGSRGALICSPTGTSERILGSSSLDKDAAALPHGCLKREALGAAAAAAAAKGPSGVS